MDSNRRVCQLLLLDVRNCSREDLTDTKLSIAGT